jgi:hypothetical protein
MLLHLELLHSAWKRTDWKDKKSDVADDDLDDKNERKIICFIYIGHKRERKTDISM